MKNSTPHRRTRSKLPILVQKFGGTSVGSIDRIQSVAERVLRSTPRCQPVVVVSAMAGETQRLVALAEALSPGAAGPEVDLLLASGEQVAVGLTTLALNRARAGSARGFLGFQVGMKTDSMHNKARIQSVDSARLRRVLREGQIPVVAGFQGVDALGSITTLGRGGSDTTAVALACALGAGCEIYTDVEGVYTTDPRLCPEARKLSTLTYEEMMELSSLGAKVLQIRSVELAAKFRVPIHVRSSFSNEEGTWVTDAKHRLEDVSVTGIAAESGQIKISVSKVGSASPLADVFGRLSAEGIVVDVIVHDQASGDLHFTIPKGETQRAQRSLSGHSVSVGGEFAKVSIVGVGMQHHPGVAAKMFEILAKAGVEIRLITTSEIKITVLVDPDSLKKAVVALHRGFGLEHVSPRKR